MKIDYKNYKFVKQGRRYQVFKRGFLRLKPVINNFSNFTILNETEPILAFDTLSECKSWVDIPNSKKWLKKNTKNS